MAKNNHIHTKFLVIEWPCLNYLEHPFGLNVSLNVEGKHHQAKLGPTNNASNQLGVYVPRMFL